MNAPEIVLKRPQNCPAREWCTRKSEHECTSSIVKLPPCVATAGAGAAGGAVCGVIGVDVETRRRNGRAMVVSCIKLESDQEGDSELKKKCVSGPNIRLRKAHC